MDKKLSLVPVWYWHHKRMNLLDLLQNDPNPQESQPLLKFMTKCHSFFARAKGPTISANRDMRNSNRKLINVHDAKRIVNLSKNSQQLLLKWKFGCFFTKWFFFWCLQCSNDSQCTPKNRDLWIPLLSGLLAARWRFLSSKQRRNEHVFF